MIFRGWQQSERFDLEAMEMSIRAATHQMGAKVLQELLQSSGCFEREWACACGQKAHFQELRPRTILTAVGSVTFQRPYYLCSSCHQGQSPRDVELDVENTDYSPGVRRMMALVGSSSSFAHGREQLDALAGLQVTTKAVERQAEAIGSDIAARDGVEQEQALQLELPTVRGAQIPVLYIEMDGTGVPMVSSEIEGRIGKSAGERARTREAKLGCVFTQTHIDKKGRPVRDEASTTYTGAIETAAEFGKRIYREAWKRGWCRAKKKVVIGDGAEWIWNLVAEHFPDAMQIVDLYHARQHLWELARQLYPNEQVNQNAWMKVHQKRLLDKGKIEKLVDALRSIEVANPQIAEKMSTEADYFERNAERMRYPKFRCQRLFIGSGVIEAGCKTVIGSRLKQSGMFWTVRGANAILALRANRLSGHFEQYWENRSMAA
ncbi:MAG: ISKra4 family transposase [Acidobacteria bacterium]|nr:ISKra4 family transposase [Acidobacteriota bacterium]